MPLPWMQPVILSFFAVVLVMAGEILFRADRRSEP